MLIVAVVAILVTPACLPGHRTKTILVTSQCPGIVWLRFADRFEATEEQMQERKSYEIKPDGLTSVEGSVLGREDGRPGSMAVSSDPNVVGTIVALPPAVGEEIRVTIASDLCPR